MSKESGYLIRDKGCPKNIIKLLAKQAFVPCSLNSDCLHREAYRFERKVEETQSLHSLQPLPFIPLPCLPPVLFFPKGDQRDCIWQGRSNRGPSYPWSFLSLAFQLREESDKVSSEVSCELREALFSVRFCYWFLPRQIPMAYLILWRDKSFK